MSNDEITIGKLVGLHKTVRGYGDLSIYGEISAVRRHWNGNPDLLEIQIGGLEQWISLENTQISDMSVEELANDCE